MASTARSASTSNAATPPATADQESGVLRYYTSQLMLRFIASDDYDPDGASFAAFGSTDAAPFLSIYETSSSAAAALLSRAPPIVVVPPGNGGNDPRMTRGIFTVLPAEGFVKDPGQPVYYNDPIELMDQKGRLLGISSRSPYAGHLAADGHNDALVFVLERHTSRLNTIGCKFAAKEKKRATANALSMSSSSASTMDSTSESSVGNEVFNCTRRMTRYQATRSSLIEICGGERLRIPGLIRVPKKQFPGGCIMQHQFFSDSSNGPSHSASAESSAHLTCEVVLTSQTSVAPVISSKSQKKKSESQVADRTAMGDFVGVLYSGVLHRRADHTKLWKKRFFVLTQVALHRFDATETLETIKKAKPTGVICLKDCRGVRYERFSRPHELDIELHSGKLVALHAVDALTCANWASVLSRAIENPHWVHAERAYLTVWRSDVQFDSPRCPKISKIILRRGGSCEKAADCTVTACSTDNRVAIVAHSPRWSEKLSLGSVTIRGVVVVQLSDGTTFHLSLEDLTKSLLHPSWIAVATSLDVGKIHNNLDDGDDDSDGPPNQNGQTQQRKSDPLSDDDSSRFLVRLKFRTDLQLDKRLTQRRSLEEEKRLAMIVCSGLVILPAFAYGHRYSMDAAMRTGCLVSLVATVLAIAALAPVCWHLYLWLKYNQSMEAELHWFLTLLAVEVRPHTQENDRSPSPSDKDPRRESRLDSCSFNDPDDHEHLDGGAIVVPTRPLSHSVGDQLAPCSKTAQAIHTFRLENALDSILGRPQFSFLAMKKFFPTRFLTRDAHGRRVFLVSLNAVNQNGLEAHNITGFNIARYFLYVWEFIWSYQDPIEGVARSELVMILDCTGWPYFKWFSIDCQLMLHVLNMVNRFYPGRLAKLIIIRDKNAFGFYGQLLASHLDQEVRAIMETHPSLAPYLVPGTTADGSTLSKSKDEAMLFDFVTNLLATYANVTIPSFTRRELEQAAHIARTGNLLENEVQANSPSNAIGTRAVLLPDGLATLNWTKEHDDGACTVFRSVDHRTKAAPVVAGKAYQSDAQVGQWRGRFKLKATSADVVLQHLNDPSLAKIWMPDQDELFALEKLSRQEDVSFWSRRVPFMSFSLAGHRGDQQKLNDKKANVFFECVVRRIYDVHQGTRPKDRVFALMWKTTSAQQLIVNRPSTAPEPVKPQSSSNSSNSSGGIQWRKLEDPLVSMCFVIEEVETTTTTTKQLVLSFWFQSLAPPATPQQTTQIAQMLAARLRSLDAMVVEAETMGK